MMPQIPQLLPALALGMKFYYRITLTAVILKYTFYLGRFCLLGTILSFYFSTYSLGEKKLRRRKWQNRLKYPSGERNLFSLSKYNYYNYRVVQSYCLKRNHHLCTDSM